MTTVVGRPIFASAIRVGDRIRATCTEWHGDTVAVEGVVTGIDDEVIRVYQHVLWRHMNEFLIISRREDNRAVGTRWEDRVTGYKYIRTDDFHAAYIRYTNLPANGMPLFLYREVDAAIIDRLMAVGYDDE